MSSYSRSQLSDEALQRQLIASFARDRTGMAELLADIAEFDHRQLFRAAGYSSMFVYCVEKFGLSEDSAYKRIRAARTAFRFPALFSAVAEGRLNLNAIVLLAPHLSDENVEELMSAACGKTRFQIEQLLTERFPKPDVAQVLRAVRTREPAPISVEELWAAPQDSEQPPIEPKAPEQAARNLPAARPVGPSEPSRVTPLSPQRFKLQLTIGETALKDLQRAQALLSHRIPDGDLERILERALRALVERLERLKYAETSRPRPPRASHDERTIPAHVRRAVRLRDGDQCTFVGAEGHRCQERRFLEFDHVREIARGGESTVEGLRLRCRAHNQYTAELAFGPEFMRKRRAGSAGTSP
jgi:hypothetical protein